MGGACKQGEAQLQPAPLRADKVLETVRTTKGVSTAQLSQVLASHADVNFCPHGGQPPLHRPWSPSSPGRNTLPACSRGTGSPFLDSSAVTRLPERMLLPPSTSLEP